MRRRALAAEAATLLQRDLQRAGLYAAKHSTSLPVMKSDKLVATIHVYSDECILSLYKPWLSQVTDAARLVESIARRHCPSVRKRLAPIQ